MLHNLALDDLADVCLLGFDIASEAIFQSVIVLHCDYNGVDSQWIPIVVVLDRYLALSIRSNPIDFVIGDNHIEAAADALSEGSWKRKVATV